MYIEWYVRIEKSKRIFFSRLLDSDTNNWSGVICILFQVGILSEISLSEIIPITSYNYNKSSQWFCLAVGVSKIKMVTMMIRIKNM